MERLEEVLESARKAGTGWIVVPGIDRETSSQAVSIAGRHGLLSAVGIHPAEAGNPGSFEEIERLAFEPGVCAIGETGLELRPGSPPLDVQRELLSMHAGLASDLDLPLICHSRGAEAETVEALGALNPPGSVLHCYTGPAGPALEAASRGWFIGFSGAVTFRRNDPLRRTLAALPRNSVLVETDSPFMSPEPVRGRTCEPAFVTHTARAVAGAWGIPYPEACSILQANSETAFRQGARARPSVIYRLDGRAYVNLTGSCCNNCRFCIRNTAPGLGGYLLAHGGVEPSEGRVLSGISRLPRKGFGEMVFCGYGEPTSRLALLGRAAALARSLGWRLRLNTNGLALCSSGLDEVLGVVKLFDAVSISLNAWDDGSYRGICRPSVPGAWDSLLAFVKLASSAGPRVRLTAVAWDGVDMARVRAVAEGLGLPLVARGGA